MAEMERYWALSDAQCNNQLGLSRHFNIALTTQIPIIYPGDEGIVAKNKKPLGPKGEEGGAKGSDEPHRPGADKS